MIDDLDRTLEQLLRQELPASIVAGVSISFAPPDSQFPPQSVTLPAIDLFLYDIRENRDLRDGNWLLERQSNGASTSRQPPMRIDCSYLITAWASDASTTRMLDEHRLLSEVMRVLIRHGSLPEAILQGSLQGQSPPVPGSVGQPGQLQSISEFWQALGGKPKAAINYTVTISMDAGVPVEGEAPVTDSQTSLGR